MHMHARHPDNVTLRFGSNIPNPYQLDHGRPYIFFRSMFSRTIRRPALVARYVKSSFDRLRACCCSLPPASRVPHNISMQAQRDFLSPKHYDCWIPKDTHGGQTHGNGAQAALARGAQRKLCDGR
jgi:hypothetical protein